MEMNRFTFKKQSRTTSNYCFPSKSRIIVGEIDTIISS